MNTEKPAEADAVEKKPYEKPQIVSAPLRDAFQSGCTKCRSVQGPLVGCGKPSQS